ncbi:hypothetical protein N864_12840 [Intrasporangium chromatireducens Q5-1]|uniref:Uncharacterized protein n=1 Tax=Intrasporangium chromatireducens Q5-1 TaxID=584657 RepID=W9GE32_9MICO|nr:hypothetical protein [Intrasporangium chromatireducens]EWT04471.1 hypothetical protein N864_12840 [Intrasporangium chromatireducens Q5-1]
MTEDEAMGTGPVPTHDAEPATETPGGPDPDVPETGDHDIDEALSALADVEGEPLARHIELGESVHRLLQGRLGGLGGA